MATYYLWRLWRWVIWLVLSDTPDIRIGTSPWMPREKADGFSLVRYGDTIYRIPLRIERHYRLYKPCPVSLAKVFHQLEILGFSPVNVQVKTKDGVITHHDTRTLQTLRKEFK